ncbi:MAG: chorismate mutase [Brumimicrobium sp.]|nr:chorismate mutase [Brumimicrobium sp.]
MILNLKNTAKKHKRPFLIAGPCSAETESQVHKIAGDLARNSTTAVLRAGIWKPRTRPNSFEGIGEEGLKWLVDAGKENGLPTTTEVANSKHVELALKAGVDILWIGARTTVNPFAVQEIADALSGVKITVMVKNPVNPDLMLWIGAFERFQKAGIDDLIAIHRGFSVYNHPKYRNVPNWEIPIALVEKMPELPLICDPSHISGKRDGLMEVAQKAMDLNFTGLMLETHNNPDEAWSDAQQQITPGRLTELISKLKLRKEKLSSEEMSYIGLMREKIAHLDDEIFSILSERMKLSEEVGIYKRENDITILQQEHWKNIIEKRLGQADDLHLTRNFIRSVMDAIHQESIRHQTKVMNPDLISK